VNASYLNLESYLNEMASKRAESNS
jgi:hypothetical protein